MWKGLYSFAVHKVFMTIYGKSSTKTYIFHNRIILVDIKIKGVCDPKEK